MKKTSKFAPAISNGLWCNGNTPVFGTDIQGSSPCRPTKVFTFFVRTFFMVKI